MKPKTKKKKQIINQKKVYFLIAGLLFLLAFEAVYSRAKLYQQNRLNRRELVSTGQLEITPEQYQADPLPDPAPECRLELVVSTPTPTPSYDCFCKILKIYNSYWQEIFDYSTISPGDRVYFVVEGECNHPQGITNAQFRINGGAWQPFTGQIWGNYYYQYQVSSGVFRTEAMVYNPVLGWL